VTVKVVPKAVCDPDIFSESRPYVQYTGENGTKREKERLNTLVRFSEQSLE
jgi:hypothetical protein